MFYAPCLARLRCALTRVCCRQMTARERAAGYAASARLMLPLPMMMAFSPFTFSRFSDFSPPAAIVDATASLPSFRYYFRLLISSSISPMPLVVITPRCSLPFSLHMLFAAAFTFATPRAILLRVFFFFFDIYGFERVLFITDVYYAMLIYARCSPIDFHAAAAAMMPLIAAFAVVYFAMIIVAPCHSADTSPLLCYAP